MGPLYFFRTLLTSREAELYTFRDVETEIEPSSFISELRLYNEEGLISIDDAPRAAIPLSALYKELYSRSRMLEKQREILLLEVLKDEALCGVPRENSWEFFSLPCEVERDFAPQEGLRLTYYALDKLLKNPFVWFLANHSGIPELNLNPEEAITRKFFGDLQHQFLSQVFLKYLAAHPKSLIRDPALINEQSLAAVLKSLLQDDKMQYKIPKNHNREFLHEIMAENLIDCVKWVFWEFLPQFGAGWKDQVAIIPEQQGLRAEEKNFKTVIASADNDLQIPLTIRGKADLRIETPLQNYIIDFKTGKGSIDQLIFYEYFYYLIGAQEPLPKCDSRFCQIFDREGKDEGITAKKREAWLAKILHQLELISKFGYLLPRSFPTAAIKSGLPVQIFSMACWDWHRNLKKRKQRREA